MAFDRRFYIYIFDLPLTVTVSAMRERQLELVRLGQQVMTLFVWGEERLPQAHHATCNPGAVAGILQQRPANGPVHLVASGKKNKMWGITSLQLYHWKVWGSLWNGVFACARKHAQSLAFFPSDSQHRILCAPSSPNTTFCCVQFELRSNIHLFWWSFDFTTFCGLKMTSQLLQSRLTCLFGHVTFANCGVTDWLLPA